MSSLKTGRRMPGLRQRGSRSGKHPEPPDYIDTRVSDPGEGVKGEELSRKHVLDDPKQTANWGRSIQSFHEEVGTGGQCSM